MRISFLHLSDFHLNDSKGVHPAKIQAIVDSLGVYTPIEGIVIVLSGDIAATGQANQYKIAATFLKRLIPEIRRKYSISEKNTKILIVPGNHDSDYFVFPTLRFNASKEYSRGKAIDKMEDFIRITLIFHAFFLNKQFLMFLDGRSLTYQTSVLNICNLCPLRVLFLPKKMKKKRRSTIRQLRKKNEIQSSKH